MPYDEKEFKKNNKRKREEKKLVMQFLNYFIIYFN